MTSTAYDRIHSLEDFEFIAGTEFIMYFNTFEEDGLTPLNITSGTVSIKLAYLGQPETAVVTQAGTITDANNGIWNVIIDSTDTEELSGAFIVQPTLIDFVGDEFRPAQGKVVIIPKIA